MKPRPVPTINQSVTSIHTGNQSVTSIYTENDQSSTGELNFDKSETPAYPVQASLGNSNELVT